MNVGRLRSALLAPRALALLAGSCIAVSLGIAWGFVVDDALIVSRFAWIARTSARHAFAADGPPVDAVTPLPYPWLVAPFARSILGALLAQRILGSVAVVLGATLLAHRLARRAAEGARIGAALLACSFPLAVHASSGLETGLATGLVAAALACAVDDTGEALARSALLFGLACTLRPELFPAALAAVAVRLTHAHALGLLARVVAPTFAVVAVRLACFGSPMPLAVLAKPSDLEHGALYVGAGLLVTGLVFLGLVALPAFRASEALRPVRRSALALATVHVLVVAAVGGDWMPYARLLVPVLPSVAVVAASISSTGARSVLAALVLSVNVVFGWRHRADAAAVWSKRASVIEALAPALASHARVAGLDVGFLGAAFAGSIVDLAGLTDPAVARLRGGHTSKALPEGFLDTRGADALVLWAPPGSRVELGPQAVFGRVVETRLARSPRVAATFEERTRIPWDASGAVLVVYGRRAPR